MGTHAATAENAAHLSAGFLEGLTALYGGTRRAAQEMEGLVVEAEGALFSAEMLAAAYLPAGSDPYDKVVVAVDPTTTATGNACGIVVVARARESDGVTRAHVLADRSAAGLSPAGWARRAVAAAREFGATTVVAEVNQGGDMVSAILRAIDAGLPITTVRASRGKFTRAEPVAALYEQGRVVHAGTFPDLEDQMCDFGPDGLSGGGSPDRMDALVWALTSLMLGGQGEPRVRGM